MKNNANNSSPTKQGLSYFYHHHGVDEETTSIFQKHSGFASARRSKNKNYWDGWVESLSYQFQLRVSHVISLFSIQNTGIGIHRGIWYRLGYTPTPTQSSPPPTSDKWRNLINVLNNAWMQKILLSTQVTAIMSWWFLCSSNNTSLCF